MAAPAEDGPASPLLTVSKLHAAILKSRGWSVDRYNAIETIYVPSRSRVRPEALQGYTREALEAVSSSDDRLRMMLEGGLNPNSQNKFGATLLHKACRLSHLASVSLLLEFGATARCADDCGKTPMHDLCWMGSVHTDGTEAIAVLLLSRDQSMLLAQDRLGFTPLDYLRPSQEALWRELLQAYSDTFWPPIRPAVSQGGRPPSFTLPVPLAGQQGPPLQTLPGAASFHDSSDSKAAIAPPAPPDLPVDLFSKDAMCTGDEHDDDSESRSINTGQSGASSGMASRGRRHKSPGSSGVGGRTRRASSRIASRMRDSDDADTIDGGRSAGASHASTGGSVGGMSMRAERE